MSNRQGRAQSNRAFDEFSALIVDFAITEGLIVAFISKPPLDQSQRRASSQYQDAKVITARWQAGRSA